MRLRLRLLRRHQMSIQQAAVRASHTRWRRRSMPAKTGARGTLHYGEGVRNRQHAGGVHMNVRSSYTGREWRRDASARSASGTHKVVRRPERASGRPRGPRQRQDLCSWRVQPVAAAQGLRSRGSRRPRPYPVVPGRRDGAVTRFAPQHERRRRVACLRQQCDRACARARHDSTTCVALPRLVPAAGNGSVRRKWPGEGRVVQGS